MRPTLRHGLCSLSALCALVSAGARAQAEPAQPRARPELAFAPEGATPGEGGSGASARSRARELTAQASAAYRSGDYAGALERYEQAYALVPLAELLFNLGQCQRQLGRDAQAHKSFRAYLQARPDAPERGQIEGWLASSAREPTREQPRAVRREQPRREAPPALAPSSARLPEVAPAPARAAVVEPALVTPHATRDRSPVARDDARASAERDEQGSIVERWWFWTAVGVAVGGGITATLLLSDDDEPAAAGSLGTVRWD